MSWRRRARAAQVPLIFRPALPPELEPIAAMPDELARLEGWAAARGYQPIYTAESGNRLSMTRPAGALNHQGA